MNYRATRFNKRKKKKDIKIRDKIEKSLIEYYSELDKNLSQIKKKQK